MQDQHELVRRMPRVQRLPKLEARLFRHDLRSVRERQQLLQPHATVLQRYLRPVHSEHRLHRHLRIGLDLQHLEPYLPVPCADLE
jgi:hypothetical protein